jgi:hypothetical protein
MITHSVSGHAVAAARIAPPWSASAEVLAMRPVSDTREWPGRLRLADDFWFVSHHDVTGRSRLGPGAVGLGLGGALLGELVLSRCVAVINGRLRVQNGGPPRDAVAHIIVEQLRAEPEHDLRTWLTHLGRDAEGMVAARLLRAGLVTSHQDRRLLRTTVVHRPVDASFAFWRSARLKQVLAGGGGRPDWQDIMLAGLVHSTGLFRAVLWEDTAAGTAYLRRCLSGAEPSIRDIIAQVAVLIGDAVLTTRG